MRKTAFTLIVFLASLVAHAQCPTADDVNVQNALDTLATTGGVMQLDARVYNICQPLIVPSNVHLRGAGRGATIIRGAATSACKTVLNAQVCADVAAVAANNVSITDLTVDNNTNNHLANGVAFIPAGVPYDGQVSTNGLVARVEVLGVRDSPTIHTYQIWNFRGQHIKIADNWVDGNSTSNSNQEGIESYGGYDVVIANNTVRNIGSSCINIGSAGSVAYTETVGLFAVNNYLDNCQRGVHVGTSNVSGDEYSAHIHVEGNVITNSRLNGINVNPASATHMRDLLIAHNTIRVVGPSSTSDPAAGIRLYPNGTIDSSAILSTTVEDNLIADIRGANAHGIRLTSYPNARVRGNTILDTASTGIQAMDTKSIEIVDNRFERTGTHGIDLEKLTGDISSMVIAGNTFADWLSTSPAIVFAGAHFGVVRDNTFRRTDTAQPLAISFASSCGVTVSGNLAWYRSWTDPSVPACP